MLNIKKIVSIVTISTLMLFLMTACAELDSHSSISRFQQSEKIYRAGMRWGEWESVLYLIRQKPDSSDSNADSVERETMINPARGQKYDVVESKYSGAENMAEQKKKHEELLAHLETITVSHTEVLNSSVSETNGTGESRILIEFSFENSAKVNSIRYKVNWWHDKESNTWFSETPIPKEFEPPKNKTIKLSPKRY